MSRTNRIQVAVCPNHFGHLQHFFFKQTRSITEVTFLLMLMCPMLLTQGSLRPQLDRSEIQTLLTDEMGYHFLKAGAVQLDFSNSLRHITILGLKYCYLFVIF